MWVVQTRAEVAEALISGYVSDHTGARMALGRLLQNGMLEEISKIDSSHRLWTWSNGKDPICRAIVPVDMLAQAVEVASIYERARAELSGLWTHSTLATALDLRQTEADELISV